MNSGRMSGSSRSLPIGWRASAVMLALVASRMNFIQSSVRIWSLSVASKPAFWHSARKASPRWLRLPSSSPKIMRMKVPTWRDHAGRGDRGADLRHAAHHGAAAEDRDQPLRRVDAVLQRDHRGVGPDQRLDVLARAFDVPQLDAEQHEIDRADALRDRRSPGSAPDGSRRAPPSILQARALHRREMRAARDEGDVGPAFASAAPNPPPTPPAPTTAIRICTLPSKSTPSGAGDHASGCRPSIRKA